jgi:DNA-binding XRE family transcriptional regulator
MASNLLLIPLAKPGVVRDLLATNILLLRRERGMSQEALAFEVGLHRTFIAHVERQVRNISIDNVERIAVGLNVHPMVLLAPNHHVLKALQPWITTKQVTRSRRSGHQEHHRPRDGDRDDIP